MHDESYHSLGKHNEHEPLLMKEPNDSCISPILQQFDFSLIPFAKTMDEEV
jgi:hypothetical protein